MKKRYKIVSPEDDQELNYAGMKTIERRATNAYKQREQRAFFCTCQNVPLRLSVSGRFYNAPGTTIAHLNDCARSKVDDGTVISPDFTKKDLLLHISYAALFRFGDALQRENLPGVENGKVSYRYYASMAFVYSVAKAIYNQHTHKAAGYSLESHIKTLYARLNTIQFVNQKDTNVSNRLIFRCGLLLGIADVRKSIENSYMGSLKKMNVEVHRDEYEWAEQSFHKRYKKKLDKGLQIMYVQVTDIINHRNRLLFYPVSNYGMPCDSFLEQRVYCNLEKRLQSYPNLYLRKTDWDLAYEDTGVDRFLDDGQICFADGSSKAKIVIEIFGMMSSEAYRGKAEIKERYLQEHADIVMLEFFPQDDEEGIRAKLDAAVKALQAMVG